MAGLSDQISKSYVILLASNQDIFSNQCKHMSQLPWNNLHKILPQTTTILWKINL